MWEFLLGALVMLTLQFPVFVMGRAVGRRVKWKGCSCGHTIAMHERNGRCRESVLRYTGRRKELKPCACFNYDGPGRDPSAEEITRMVRDWKPPV